MVYSQHAKERAWERYGISLSREIAEIFLAAARAGKAMLAKSDQERGNTWAYLHNGSTVIFITDFANSVIITFAPKNYLSAGQAHKRGIWRNRTKRSYPKDFDARDV